MLKQGMGKNSCLVFIFIFCFHCYAIVGVELGDTEKDITVLEPSAETPGNGETQLSSTTLPPIIDLCYSNPCINGGSCSMDGSSFKCDCGVGLTGNICETAIGECIPPDPTNGCPPQSDCAVTPNGNVCVCRGNFKGKKCDIADKLITCTKDLAIRYAPSIDRRPTSVKCFKTRTTDDDPCTDPDDPTQYELVAGVDSPGVTLLPEDSEGRVCLQLDFRDRPFPGDKLCVDVAAFEKDDIVLRPWRNATMHVCISLDHSPTIDLIPQVTYNVADETSWKNSWYILASDSDNDALTYSINATVPDGYLDYFNVESTTGKVTLVTTPSITDWLLVTLTVLVSQSNNPNQAAVAQAEVHFYNFSITCSQDDIIIGLNNQQDSAIGQIQCTSSMNEDLTYNYVNPLSEYENIFVSENGALSLRSPLTDPGTHYVMVLVKGTLVINNRNNILADDSLSGVESLVAQSEVKFNLIAGYFEPTCDIFEASFSEDTTVGTCNDISVCSSKTYGNTPVCTTTDVSILFETNCKPLTDSDIAGIATTVCSVADLKGNAGEFHVNLSVSNEYGMTELSVPFTVLPSEENVPPTFLNTPYAVSVYEDNEVGSSIFTDYYTDPDEGDAFTIYLTDNITQFYVSISAATKSFSLILAEKLNVASIDSYEFSLAIRDSAGGSAQTSVVVSVLDVNEPPVCTRLPVLTLDDPQPMVTEIATVQCSDPDVKTEFSTLTYALDGLETESFTIDDKGILYAAANLATEPSIYVFYVIVSDGGGLDDTVIVTVIINYVCEPGQSSDTGRVPCTDCPQGQYQDKPGQTDCVDCPSQQRTPNSGSTSEVECIGGCSPGQYSSTGYAPCLQCPLGEYQSSSAQTQCIGCSGSKTTVETGSDSEDFCIDVFPPSCEKDGLEVEISEESPPGSCYSIATSCTDPQNSPSDLTYDLSDPSKLFELGEEIGASTIEICHVGSLQGSSSNWNVNLTISNAYGSKWIMLVVTVTNVLHLPVFSSSQYNISVKEDAEIGTEVLTVEATDVDLVGNLLFSLEGDAAFVIDSTTGVLTVAETLDAAKLYELTVSVKDTEEALSSATATVVVTVIDVNVPPICPEAVSLNLDITAAVGFLVGTVDCIDNDVLEEYKTITYSISGPESENFAVGLETGDITTKAILVGGPLLYEFTVTAADGGKLSSVVAVSVSLNNVFPPSCEKDGLEVEISEESPPGSCYSIATSCTDPQNSPSDLTYDLSDPSELFELGEEIGASTIEICHAGSLQGSSSNWNVNLTISNAYGSKWIMLVVTVSNVLHLPVFSSSQYNISVKEDAEIGTEVLTVEATDVDLVGNLLFSLGDATSHGSWVGTCTMWLDKREIDMDTLVVKTPDGTPVETRIYPHIYLYGEGDAAFVIDSTTGVVTVAETLDAAKLYELTVSVKDTEEALSSATATVVVTVIDVNVPPICPEAVSLNLDITAAVGFLVGTVDCIDNDVLEEYKTITYSISGPESENFAVGLETGNITTKAILVGGPSLYEFTVTAADGGKLSSVVAVSVSLNTDYQPTCEAETVSKEIYEDVTDCFPVDVVCNDPLNEAAALNFILTDNLELFTVGDSEAGVNNLVLCPKVKLKPDTLNLNINVTSKYGFTLIMVVIEILDVNEPPRFLEETYQADIEETLPVGSSLSLIVSATDDDTGEYGVLQYSTDSVDFSISDGSLFLQTILNATAVDFYRFIVTAEDGGGLSTTTIVEISVIDINEPPTCPGDIEVKLDLTTAIETLIGKTGCYDADKETDYRTIVYDYNQKEAGPLSVTNNGEIYVSGIIPKELTSYVFPLRVLDKEMQINEESGITVDVSVVVNANFPPKCSDTELSAEVQEDEIVNRYCLTSVVTCSDPTGGVLTIESEEGDGRNLMAVMSRTVETSKDLLLNLCLQNSPAQQFGTYTVTVTLSNGIGETTVTWTFSVIDVNDSPKFSQSSYNVSIPETSEVGSAILSISASDKDTANDFAIVGIAAEIIGEQSSDISFHEGCSCFKVDVQLNATFRSVYEFQLEVVDGGGLTDMATVTITVNDVNENPECDNSPLLLSTNILAEVGKNLGSLNCHDYDLDPENKELTYTTSGSDAEYFEVTGDGEVVIAKTLPRLSQSLTFMVIISDNAVDSRRTSVMVEVSVDNAFPAKCSPSFRYPDKWVIGSCLELSLNCEDETMTDTDHLTNFLSGNYTTGFEKTSDDNADPIVLCYKLDMTSETFVITVEVNNELGTFEYTAYIVVEYMASTPTFDMTVYIVNISETTGAESEVVTVTATASSEGTIVYSILGSSSMPRWQEFFSIDSQGTVTTVKSVAELVTETVVLAVEAVDDISELKSTVNVEITVFDVNEPPSCDIGDVNVTIELISNVGYPLKMFNCSDPDVSARNKRLVFNMGENDVNSQYFEIVESDASVKIKVRSKLPVDRSKYKLLIEVSDMGDPPESLSYTIHVTVNLMPSAPLVAATVLDSHTVLVEWSYARVEFLDITTKFLLIIRSGDSEVRKLDFPHDQSSVKVDSLSPETTYVISVAGYVRKGLSPPGTVTIKTTGVSVITKMVASMRFPDEIYMSSFGDENSVAFSEEKQKIIDNLSPIFQKQSGFESVDVVSLRQGSVIADTVISINQNGNMTDTRTTLQQTVSSGWIGKFTVDPTYLITEDGDGYVSVTSLESSDATLSDGSNVMFTCHVDTIGNTGQVKFSWLWRGVLVQPLNSRINITHDLSNYKAVGYLTFNPIMKKDDGSLVCSVQSEDGTMVSQEAIQINVFVKPTVTLYPMSWSLMMDKSVILTCTADRDADILWYLNDETFSEPADIEIIKVSDKQEKLLIKRLESMIHISCEAIVDKETGPRATATVGVIAGKDGLDPIYCPTSTDRREMLWDMTMPGLQSMKDCPNGLRGTVLRMCSSDGEWKEADYDGCVSQMIQDVMNQLAAMMDGLSDVTIEDTLNDMASATDSHELVTGELQKTAEILAEIIIIEKMMDEIIEEDVLGKFVEVASNVIGEQNKGEFYVLLQQNKTGASSIMKVVSEFSEMTSAKFPDNDHSKIISKKNIVVEFGKSKPKELKFPDGEKKEYPSWIKTSSNGLILNKEAIVSSLGSESNVSFSSVFYRNMSSIVHIYQESEIENEEHENVTVNSDILSLTLTPHPANLDPPLQITFEHISKNFSNAKCSYWKFQVPNTPNGAWSTSGCSLKSSSDRVTVCECYHLTNFAILMSPVVTPIVHALPLSIISAVGCAISLLCLLMTIGAHLFLWRYVKSDRTIILMNLCVALLIAYVLFIAGVDRTENKAICTVIAALLHYFYLVVFFLMLAEGIEIAFTVLYVFSIKSRIKWMIPLAWAIPAMIVGLSLGITQLTGYGNSQFCWLSVDDALIFAFIGPALVVILINLVIISAAFNAMFKTSVMLTKSAKQQAKTGLRSLCILLPVMGLTWVFGVFSVNEDLVFFQYLFAICNSFQGLFIFIFHCVLSRQVQEGIAHKRRRKKSLAEFSSRSTTRGSPIKSRDSDSSVVLEKKVSPFLVVDRQVHEMARKLKMSTDEHNLEDSNVRKDDNVRLVSLDDVKILNLSEMTKTPLGPSASDNPSMQTTSTTTEPPKSPHLHDEEIERNDKLNDLDKNYQDYKSYLEPNIPPAQIHFPDSLQHQQTKRLDKKLQRKPYTKCDSEGPVGKHMSTNNISEPASPVFQNPVYPMEKVDEIHPSRSTMSRISETVRDSLYMTPVGEDSEKKLQESQERLKSVYSNSNDAFSHEIQGKEPRRERKLEKNHSYSSRDSRKMQEKYGSKSKQTAAAKQKHGRSRDQLQGYEYEYEYEYVPSEPQTYMEDYSAEYMEYHPYGGIRSGTRSRYPRSEGYNSQFNYPWGDQYVEYW